MLYISSIGIQVILFYYERRNTMFVQYFGNYLVENNIISHPQYELIVKQQKDSRVKLGFIAVAEKLLTKNQADEINELQKLKTCDLVILLLKRVPTGRRG